MNTVRPISRLLFWLSMALCVFCGLTGLYASFVLLTGSGRLQVSNGVFHIMYPFSHADFLLGDYDRGYITMMLLALLGYSVYFGILGAVFRVFGRNVLFTPDGVSKLNLFYRINFLAPLSAVVLGIVLHTGVQELLMITLLHSIIGIFAYFMACIFNQGLTLQREQDLTI